MTNRPPRLRPNELEQHIRELWELDNPVLHEDEGSEPKPDVKAWYLKYESLEFGRRIDKGSYGAVYHGMYEGSEVAIKEITALDTEEDIFYIDREVKALVRACHQYIVNFIGVSKHKACLFIVTEYIQGGNLRQWLKKKEYTFPWNLRIKTCLQTAKALQYLQKRGMVHRDIKAKNLLVYAEDWQVKLCDFGFARMAAAPGRPMTICGTQAYMAPEIVAGQSDYNVAADVYSFGILMAEVITRYTPEDGLTNKIPPGGLNFPLFDQLAPADCPPRFFKLSISCCSIEPKDRPSFDQLVELLEELENRLETDPGTTFVPNDLSLGEVLGHGLCGVVRKGVLRGMKVVGKVIPRRDVDEVQMVRYEKEKSTLMVLRSPNLAQYLGTCYDDMNMYLVSEYVEGMTLGKLLESVKSVNVAWQVRYQIALDATRAMHYLHSKGVLHRDFKPSNLIVEHSGHVKVADFGIARPESKHRYGWSSSVYVAPELRDGGIFHRPSDVYSFGVVLGYLLTFLPPDEWMLVVEDKTEKPPVLESKDKHQSPLNRVFRTATVIPERDMSPPKAPGQENMHVFDEERFLQCIPSVCPKDLVSVVLACVDPLPSRRPTFQALLDRFVNWSGAYPVENGMMEKVFDAESGETSGESSLPGLSAAAAISALDDLLGSVSHGRIHTRQTSNILFRSPVTESPSSLFIVHLDKLIRRATNEDYPEPDYARDMLLAYPSFCTPFAIVDGLSRRVKEKEEVDEKKGIIMLLRIANLLKRWITDFYDDLEKNATLKQQLAKYVADNLSPVPTVATRLGVLLKGDAQQLHRRMTNREESTTPDMPFLTVHATELARQITVLDTEIYSSIHPRELFNVIMKLGDPNTCAPGVFRLDRRFSELSNWVSREVLSHQDLKQRVSVVARFIETAEQLRLLKNFGSLFAVMIGLFHPAIQRLQHTWKDLPRIAIKRISKLRELLTTNSNGDFEAYLVAESKASAPMLPYMDAVIRELDQLNQTAPTALPNGLINFNKLRSISQRIYRALDSARGNYEVIDNPVVRHFVLCSLADDTSDSDLRRMSMLCE